MLSRKQTKMMRRRSLVLVVSKEFESIIDGFDRKFGGYKDRG